MQTSNTLKSLLIGVVILFSFSNLKAQTASDPFTYGSVWTMQMIDVKPGMLKDYLTGLKASVKLMNDEAVKQGLILSYKILTGTSSSPDDYNLIIMQEYKNMAALEGKDDQWEAIRNKFVGNDDQLKQLMQTRTSQRDIYGSKTMREVILK